VSTQPFQTRPVGAPDVIETQASGTTDQAHDEDTARRRRQRYASLPGQGPAERRLRRRFFDNGLSAYNRLREEPFELLLTDIVMPEMDGIELARRATELDPDIKVMFITGFAAVALNPDSQTPKDAKVLSKPFHLRELVNEVESCWPPERPFGIAQMQMPTAS
jgi:two-component system cell cycle response regulator CpdR